MCEIIDLEKFKPLAQEKSYQNMYDVRQNLLHQFYPNQYDVGMKDNDRFYCNQKIFVRRQPDSRVKMMWTLLNVGHENFFNKPEEDWEQHHIQSGEFETLDGMRWMIKFHPGTWSSEEGQEIQRPNPSQLSLYALPSLKEKEAGIMNRKALVSLSIFHPATQ